MLDRVLVAFEQQLLTAIDTPSIPLNAMLTRRAFDYKPPKTDYYAVDVTILPATGTGHPMAGMRAEIDVRIEVYGRGTRSTSVMDRVRFLEDLATERAFAGVPKLFGKVDSFDWERTVEIAEGAAVIVSATVVRTEVLHTFGGGGALGINEHTEGDFGPGIAAADLATAVVYGAALDGILVGPATVTGYYAGLPTGTPMRIELNDDGGVAAAALLGATEGVHDFTSVLAGDYYLTIVRDSDGEEYARSGPVRVRDVP